VWRPRSSGCTAIRQTGLLKGPSAQNAHSSRRSAMRERPFRILQKPPFARMSVAATLNRIRRGRAASRLRGATAGRCSLPTRSGSAHQPGFRKPSASRQRPSIRGNGIRGPRGRGGRPDGAAAHALRNPVALVRDGLSTAWQGFCAHPFRRLKLRGCRQTAAALSRLQSRCPQSRPCTHWNSENSKAFSAKAKPARAAERPRPSGLQILSCSAGSALCNVVLQG